MQQLDFDFTYGVSLRLETSFPLGREASTCLLLCTDFIVIYFKEPHRLAKVEGNVSVWLHYHPAYSRSVEKVDSAIWVWLHLGHSLLIKCHQCLLPPYFLSGRVSSKKILRGKIIFVRESCHLKYISGPAEKYWTEHQIA